jgi:hypothetical protein
MYVPRAGFLSAGITVSISPVSNFTSKLIRGSLHYTEALELADALCYAIEWRKRK